MVALKTRGLRIATRCLTLDQFVATFHRFCDAQTVFISTLTPRTIGLETPFSINLADDSPALRGVGVVLESWATPQNPFGRPGLKLGIKKLASESESIFDRMLFAREALAETPTPVASMMPVVVIAKRPAVTDPINGERTPGSELVLPANPLMNIDDKSLAGFVDCTLYEETGNFFPAQPVVEDPVDPVVAPPLLAPRRTTGQQNVAHGPNGPALGTLPPTNQLVVNKLTPPMGASAFVPSGQLRFGSRARPPPRTVPPATLQTATDIAERMAIPLTQPAPPALPPPLPPAAPSLSSSLSKLRAHSMTGSLDVPGKAAWISSETAEMLEPDVDNEPSVVSTLPSTNGARPPSLAELDLTAQSHAPATELAPNYPSYDQRTHASGAYVIQAPTPHISNAFPVQSYRSVERHGHRKRWMVVGSIATATIAIALIAASQGGGRSKAASPEPAKSQLVASNTERTRPVVAVEPAHGDKPVADTTTTDSTSPLAAEPGPEESSAAQIIGKGPCKIAISATPAGSMISVDGEPVGPSPLTVAGPCTKRKIDVSHPRYAPAEKFMTPKQTATGEGSDAFDVTLERPTHNLFVETQPSGAVVSIDGHRAGTSPTMVKVMGFSTLTLKIEKPGFKPQIAKVYSKTAVDRRSIKLSR